VINRLAGEHQIFAFDRDDRSRDQEEIEIEHADEVEQCIESRDDLAALDAGDVHLGQSDALP